jgi:hypothetical protein
MRNVHARHKLYTNTMRVKEVVKLTKLPLDISQA